MTLRQKQSLFAHLVAQLLLETFRRGYEVTLAEAYRSPEEARRLAATGRGIVNSLHCQRLAVDLNLFRNGVYLTDSEAWRPMGEWWERQHPLCRWGGNFRNRDGNHFSMTHGGRS